MKTIEERAKEFALRDFPGRNKMKESILELKESANEAAYIVGATEQKAIDIEKAKNAFNKTCGWLSTFFWYNEVFENFMKNLEE